MFGAFLLQNVVQRWQKSTVRSFGPICFLASFSAVSDAIFCILGMYCSTCSMPLKARFELRYWLMAAWVVPSLLAAWVWENWYFWTSSLASMDR